MCIIPYLLQKLNLDDGLNSAETKHKIIALQSHLAHFKS
jgi:hypothetical protein